MKIGICCAKASGLRLDPSLLYIAVDKGLEILHQQGIKPIYVIGDFDSIQDKSLLSLYKLQVLPQVKDRTDTEEALIYALDKKYDEIYIYGVMGGRQGHFLAALRLLEKYKEANIHLLDNQNDIYLLKPGKHLIKNKSKYVSFFSLEPTVISIQNAKYPLDKYLLERFDPLCVSNEHIGEYIEVETEKHLIIVEESD